MKKSLLILLLIFVATSSIARGKNDKKEKIKEETIPVYIVGASFSFSDTIVYFTEIQRLDEVTLVNGFLPHRQYYSYELKDYMSFQENMPGRISVVYFSDKKEKLKKKEQKIRERLVKKENMTIRYLGDKFKFTKP